MKHDWQRHDDGKVDDFALDVDDLDRGGHNGPRCERCERVVCQHCVPNYDDEECPADKAVGRDLDPWSFATREDW